MRWLLAPTPPGHANLGGWLDSVASAHGFSKRQDFLAQHGVKDQNARELCASPSDEILELIDRYSVIDPRSVREMTLLCLRYVKQKDFSIPNRQIGVINHASKIPIISQIGMFIDRQCDTPIDAHFSSIREIEEIFHKLRGKISEPFTLNISDAPPIRSLKYFMDASARIVKSGNGINFLRNNLPLENIGSYTYIKYYYLARWCERISLNQARNGGRHKIFVDEEERDIIKLIGSGQSVGELASLYGVSKMTIYKVLKQHSPQPPYIQ